FYRADPSRRRDGEGAGLGLAITRAIVHAHGGNIAAANGPGMVRFTIFLPARQDAVSGSPAR
ncbi:MAG: ATP-binding protein, partial [Gammaproteobacteria bacterium]